MPRVFIEYNSLRNREIEKQRNREIEKQRNRDREKECSGIVWYSNQANVYVNK